MKNAKDARKELIKNLPSVIERELSNAEVIINSAIKNGYNEAYLLNPHPQVVEKLKELDYSVTSVGTRKLISW